MLSKILILFLHISLIFGLPTKQFKYSLMVEKQFHTLNYETVVLQGDSDLRVVPSSSQKSASEWFSGLLSSLGSFKMNEQILKLSEDGTLSLVNSRSVANTDEEKSRITFSIIGGKLTYNGLTDFTLCPASKDHSSYSIHLTQSTSSDCVGKIDGLTLTVLNQLGVQAKDFEAPEFLYNTGKLLFI